jgi:ATP-dependent DNA helicase RecQ
LNTAKALCTNDERPGTLSPKLEKILQEVFGIHTLRPGQQEVIHSVMDGKDTLAVMPTGAGKSLCYQLPGIARGGLTLVVSPLISLMKDQSDHLLEAGVLSAALNSTLSAEEERQAVADVISGESQFLFVTPERLANADFVALLNKSVQPRLIVIDEAHCISQWGHDFRPAFIEMTHSIKALGRPPVLALTATATPFVLTDILKALDMVDASLFNTGVYRDNLRFSVKQLTNPAEKRACLIEKVTHHSGAGIVYCSTVAECNAVHAALVDASVKAERYNGKMSAAQRAAAQDAFMGDVCRVIVATNAFGMGIDKPDIRFVIHAQLPGSLEAYYQEAGRAGRDGQEADCILLFEMKDRQVQQFFLAGKHPSAETIERVVDTFSRLSRESKGEALTKPVDALREALPDIGKTKLRTVLALMLDSKVATRTRRGAIKLRADLVPDAIGGAAKRCTAMAENDRAVLDQMIGYAQSARCRWRILLDYFDADLGDVRLTQPVSQPGRELKALPKVIDELGDDSCGNCDNCLAPPIVIDAIPQEQERIVPRPPKWDVGATVTVRKYGEGAVEMVSGDRVAIRFPDGETRTFLSRFVNSVGP